MNNVNQFLADTHRALASYDNLPDEKYVNTGGFGATEKFNDMWNNAQQELQDKYNLPAFHLWESGYVQGDASDEEVFEAVKNINEVEYNEGANEANMGHGFGPSVRAEYDEEEAEIDTDIFEFLNSKLLDILKPQVEKLIEEYQTFCKSELDASLFTVKTDTREEYEQ